MPKISIIILTYNQFHLTKRCLDSINSNTPEDFELIVVDNNSTDETVKYLQTRDDIITVFNRTNLGFAKGCNQGIKKASGDYILLLNNDTVVTKNWLSNMMELLCSNDKIGMVGPLSNYASGQQIEVSYTEIKDLEEFSNHLIQKNRRKSTRVYRLVGFCMLIKREVFNKIGLFDETFEIGSFEDDDLCFRAIINGFQLRIAQDSFVHHEGHATFTGNQELDIHHYYHKNREHFYKKWNMDSSFYLQTRPEVINVIPKDAKTILDIGCGAGGTGVEILNRQNCKLYGIELHPLASEIAKGNYYEVLNIDVEKGNFSYPRGFFDVIIFSNILEYLNDPFKVIKQCSNYLKPEGIVVGSISNSGYAESLIALLEGKWNYTDIERSNQTQLRYFTENTVKELFPHDLFYIDLLSTNDTGIEQKTQLFLIELAHLANKFNLDFVNLEQKARAYQFLIRAIKVPNKA